MGNVGRALVIPHSAYRAPNVESRLDLLDIGGVKNFRLFW